MWCVTMLLPAKKGITSNCTPTSLAFLSHEKQRAVAEVRVPPVDAGSSVQTGIGGADVESWGTELCKGNRFNMASL